MLSEHRGDLGRGLGQEAFAVGCLFLFALEGLSEHWQRTAQHKY